MRLFIAIDIPEEIISGIKKLQAELDSSLASFKLVKSYHITLKFLGEVNEAASNDISSELEKVNFSSFNLITSEIGAFPDKDNARVIWLGLDESKELSNLYGSIKNNLLKFDFKKEFNFHPHITLARVSYIKNKQKFTENLSLLRVPSKTFNAGEFILYESTLTKDGPV